MKSHTEKNDNNTDGHIIASSEVAFVYALAESVKNANSIENK